MILTRVANALGLIYGIQGAVSHCAWSLYQLKDGSYALTAVPNA